MGTKSRKTRQTNATTPAASREAPSTGNGPFDDQSSQLTTAQLTPDTDSCQVASVSEDIVRQNPVTPQPNNPEPINSLNLEAQVSVMRRDVGDLLQSELDFTALAMRISAQRMKSCAPALKINA